MSVLATMVTAKLPYIVRDRDRHGSIRVYFRRNGKKTRILHPIGSPEFIAAYSALLASAEKVDQIAKPAAGTLRWLCAEYYGSADFRQLGSQTQHVRRMLLEHVCQEPTQPGSSLLFGNIAYGHITAKAVRVIRDRKMEFPESANARVKALRQVFSWAIDDEDIGLQGNPAKDVRYLRGKAGGFHSWTVEEVEAFEKTHPVGTKPRLALALLLYTGQRRSDIILFGRQHIRDGVLRFTQQKGRERRPMTLQLPVLPALQRIIEASPTGDLTFLLTEFGEPYTNAGFGNWFRRQCDAAGIKGCSAHGLRKAGAAIAANNGATTHQLMAIFGWLSLKQAELYTRSAQQKRLAKDGMKLLMRNEDET